MRPARRNNPRFVQVSRGLAGVRPEEVDTRNLGSHWSTEPEVAWNFALSRDSDGYANEWDDSEEPSHGTVVHGMVHRRHIIQPGTPEFEDWAGGEGVFGPSGPEREQTVRPGAPVHVRSMYWDTDEEGVKPQSVQHSQFFRGRA